MVNDVLYNKKSIIEECLEGNAVISALPFSN